jgi:signal transduction histidine kinase
VRKHGPKSLRAVLTKGLIQIQAVVLVAFTLLAGVPVLHAISQQQGLDDGVIDDITRSIQRTDDGGLAIEPIAALQRVAEEYPAFWFVAVDADGHQVEMGNAPAAANDFPLALTHVSSANLSDFGGEASSFALIRARNAPIGRLWVLTGGGPPVGLGAITRAFSNPFFIGLLGLLSAATLLSTPVLIRRSLSGLDQLSRQAAFIDMRKSDVRLSYDKVPHELVPLVRAFNEALDRLDGGIARQKRFLADAAHELRTPIAILQTRLETLPDGPDKRQLQRDSARLAGMANELLDLHRIVQSQESFETVDLVEMAAQVTADLAPLAIDAGDDIEFHAPNALVRVKGDASALSRALANLVHNAMSHGGPNVAIRVEVTSDGRLCVSDNGPGVDARYREEIFWPFHRLSQSPHGAGLGLSLVRDIVRHHGGKIGVTTAPQGGALFEISLPLLADAP